MALGNNGDVFSVSCLSTIVVILLDVLCYVQCYIIGVGIADVTGPSVGVTFMGYANIEQKGQGIHLRQFSRAFIISSDGQSKLVFVSVDCGMIGHGVKKEVIHQLQKKYGKEYTIDNVMLSGTHTHSAPGGYLMDFLFDLSSLGFVQDTFDALVKGIVRSIVRAHDNQKEGKLFISKGMLIDANVNRSPTAYLKNPEWERALYEYDTDKLMVVLKFKDTNDKPMGMISWYAVHPTSMNYTNKLVSTDNVGYASVLLEQKMNPKNCLIGKGPFVAAFASTNLGDVSPNTAGPRCELSRKPCDMYTSKCVEHEFCVSPGPGVNMFESTKIIAQKLSNKAMELWRSGDAVEIKGEIKYVHQFIRMPSATAEYTDPSTGKKSTVRGCLPAMGHSFAAGTTDGPGLFSFKQGDTMPNNPLWNVLANALATPSANQVYCHGIKPILLTTGEMNFPFEWQPEIVPTQLATLGHIAIVCVPAEFTTMSGRRLRSTLRRHLSLRNDSDVIIAGLCNMYTDYVTTPEEYQAQRYEGASTIYGPHTLTLYLNQYLKLANILNGKSSELSTGPDPPDFLNDLISLLPPVIFDAPKWGSYFGDCVKQPPSTVHIGDTVTVRFVAGHPRNDVRQEGTFLTVERLDEQHKIWIIVLTDADWDTQFIWERTSFLLGNSEVEIRWRVEQDTIPGYYRIRHFGNSKSLYEKIEPYVGVSQVFSVVR